VDSVVNIQYTIIKGSKVAKRSQKSVYYVSVYDSSV
jgi:hypothetical protein